MSMNGTNGDIGPIPQIMLTNPVIDLLTQMLARAKAGEVTSVAVIAVSAQGGVGAAAAGGQSGDLYVGCGMLMSRIMQQIEHPPAKSSLVRATVVG